MTIETKYNIGDEVWVMSYNNHIHCDRIVSISIKSDLSIMYNFQNMFSREEKEIFPTKEELLKSL
jgi:hypothetical protein